MKTVSAWLLLIAVLDFASSAQAQHDYQILDHLRQQTVSDLAWSPDGATLAFSVRRSPVEEIAKSVDFYWGESRDEISLWDCQSGNSTKLYLPGDGSAGAWEMAWSDDGAYLAFLSDADGLVNLWVWDRNRQAVRQVTTDGIGRMGCEWVSLTDMICGISETDGYQKPNYSFGGRGFGGDIDAVRQVWVRAERGENTASVVDSLSFPLHPHAIFRISVNTGAKTTLGSAYLEYNRGRDFAFKPSSDGDHVVLRTDSSSAFPRFIRSRSGHPGEISIHQSDGAALELGTPLPSDVVLSTVKWSPDGRYLGFFALNDKPLHKDVLYEGKWEPLVYPDVDSKEYPGSFYIVDTEDNSFRQLDMKHVDLGRTARPPEYQWRGSAQIIFYTVMREERMTSVASRWITLGLDGETIANSDDLAGLSPGLVRADDGSLYGIIEGRLARIDAHGQLQLVQRDGESISVVGVWGSTSNGRGLASADVGLSGELYSIDLKKNTIHGPYELGSDFPQFSALSDDIYAYTEIEEGVERLQLSKPSGVQTIVEMNAHMQDIKRFRQRVFSYTSANGTEAKGVITFPYRYMKRKRYPTVVVSDIGYGVHGQLNTTQSYELPGDSLADVDAMTFAAAGYVYVFLSMPTNELDDVGRANLLNFNSGILPGVDWLVREEIADSDRVFLFGGSSMGYGVLGLVTQTNRFAAAISAFGYNDVSRFRDLDLEIATRYSPAAFDEVTGRGGYGVYHEQPSFLFGEGYRRNTAMTYVDRVVTPLMIITGDMDGSTMQNLEPFYSALVLRRVPTRFVRYWGVGHFPQGVENRLDYYARIIRWLDYWGDIQRDEEGDIVWGRNQIEPRPEKEMPPLELYRSYPLFGDEITD